MRLIDADELNQKITEEKRAYYDYDENDFGIKLIRRGQIDVFYKVMDIIKETKTVAPVRHGRWDLICDKDTCYIRMWRCSCCNVDSMGDTTYCPNCGAVMDEKEEP